MSTTKTNAAKLAPRLKMLDGTRLGLYLARPGGSSKQTERSVYKLLRELEQRGVPVAYVDTPRRVPRVEKDGDVFVIDYFMLEKRVPRWKRQGMETLRGQFELQGINRSLRLAGAKPGDRIRVDKAEFDLWEYPDATWMSSDGTAGILHYDYVLIEPLSTTNPDANVARAEELMPRVVEALLA